MLAAVDRRPWVIPVITFAVVTVVAAVLRIFGTYLSFTAGTLRQQVYSSLTGSSSALLGFLIAAVTILAAFGRRPGGDATSDRRERNLASARSKIIVVLLTAAFFMLALLVSASLALALSNSADRLVALDWLICACAAAGVAGLAYGCLGLGLAVAERSR